jgi:hypothetical protein
VSAPAPVLSTGAAAAAPGGALHFGMGLRARFAAPAGRRPSAVAGLPFATLGRRMAPSPLSAPRPAAAGLAWRALGAAPLREEAAPANPRPWRGALGQAPAEAQLDAGGFDAPLPELLPAESALVGRDPGAPFHPLPQAPVRPAPAAPASHGRSGQADGAADGSGSAIHGGSMVDGGSAVDGGGPVARGPEGGGMIGAGTDAAHAAPVFPGLPERLVPAWAMGQVEAPPAAGSHLPRTVSPASLPAPHASRRTDAGGAGRGGPGVPGGGGGAGLSLPGRAPALAMGAPGAAGGDGGPSAPPRSADASARAAGDGGRAAAESRAFADAVGFTPLSWPAPAPGGGETDATAQLPALPWAETGGGATAAVAPPPGETHVGGEPGPYAPTLLHGITLAAQSLATAVERRETVREARREAQEAGRPPAAPAPPPPPAVDPTSDEVVRTLMRKMTAMAREERFRAGGLR